MGFTSFFALLCFALLFMSFFFRKLPILSGQVAPSNNRLTSYYLSNLDRKTAFPVVPAKKQRLNLIGLALVICLSLNQSLYSDWLGLAHLLPSLVSNEGMRHEKESSII